jgi:glycosyltransferase involved in cell wall biosynthesis
MSVYNGQKYLREAIDSVLNQTFADFELIAIDDGSTDGSGAVLREYTDPRLKLLTNETNLGLIGSLNRGLAAARGEYVARQDCDDLLEPERLAKQVAYLDAHPDVVLVGTWMQLIDEHGADITLWRYPTTNAEIRWAMLFNTAVGHPAAMFRAAVARDAGGYSPDFLFAEDYDLWSRLAARGNVANIPEPLQRYRVHGNTVSTKNSARQMQTRLAISKRNIEQVSRELSGPAMQLVSQATAPRTKRDLLDMTSAYTLLLGQFKARYPLSEDVERRIRDKIIEKLSTAFQHVGWFDRIGCLIQRARFFPVEFWIRGRFVSFVLSDRIKRKIARWIGKKSGTVVRG